MDSFKSSKLKSHDSYFTLLSLTHRSNTPSIFAARSISAAYAVVQCPYVRLSLTFVYSVLKLFFTFV